MHIAWQARTGLVMTLLLTLLTGLAYPLAMTGLAQVLFPHQANGSLLRDAEGAVIGAELIGQVFSRPEYFHPRPSAAGDDGYDASASGATNLGPTNQRLIDLVRARAAAYRQENGLAGDSPVPVDAVTASASGLDPHISRANALLQVPRVARARGLSQEQVRALVDRYTEGRTLSILGEPRVNVLKLNLALDRLQSRK
ncbi:MAG: potassium-transporting ATPase subunit C [Chloroflexota bacterium]